MDKKICKVKNVKNGHMSEQKCNAYKVHLCLILQLRKSMHIVTAHASFLRRYMNSAM